MKPLFLLGLMVVGGGEQVYGLGMSAVLEELDETAVSLDEFAELWAAHERHEARLLLAVARFDESGEYGVDCALTMAAWLREACRMADAEASSLVRRSRFLRKFPPVAAAAVDSTLSSGHVRALQHSVTRRTEAVFAECAEDQVAAIAPLSVRDAEQQCAVWKQHADAITEQPEPSVPDRKLSYGRAGDGTIVGQFVFEPALATETSRPCRVDDRCGAVT
jgi:Domain of unknown function (DUF222)